MQLGRFGFHKILPGGTLPGKYIEIALCTYVHRVIVPMKQWAAQEETFGEAPTIDRDFIVTPGEYERDDLPRVFLGRYSWRCFGKYSRKELRVTHIHLPNDYPEVYEIVVDPKPVYLITWRVK